jgi:hypothetical protein
VQPPFNLNTVSRGVSAADFYLSVPTAIIRFLETDSQTKLVAPQLRGQEGQKITLASATRSRWPTRRSDRSAARRPGDDAGVVLHLQGRRHQRHRHAARHFDGDVVLEFPSRTARSART